MKAIIGKKVGMSQIFDENGKVIPVTVIEAGPCTVVQKKTSDKEGYEAVQLGYEDIPERKLSKPEMGHLNKAGVAPKKYLREFNLDNAAELNVGDIVNVPISHGEGRFIATAEWLKRLADNGQIATQYVDLDGNPSSDVAFNPNNSDMAIEGITSPDGRVFGKMGHSERIDCGLYKNVVGNYDIRMFDSAVHYFK